MPDRPPFDMLRAAFFVFAALIGVDLFITILYALACIWTINITQTMPVGSCAAMRDVLRETWGEALAMVLALLLAAKKPPDT